MRRRGVAGHNVRVDVITLKPRPPVRAFAIAAVSAVLGAVAIVLGGPEWWGLVLRIVGGALVALAVLLLLATIGAVTRNKVRIELDETGYAVTGPQGARSGGWDDVVRVTQSASGRRITLHHRDGSSTYLIGRTEGVELVRLRSAIVQYMDANRGYRSPEDSPEAG
jgi:hypothetical protein